MKNNSIKCSVNLCKHNKHGASCCLEEVSITNADLQKTCCGSFCEKD